MNLLYSIYNRLKKKIDHQHQEAVKAALKFCGINVSIDATCLIFGPDNMEIGDNSLIAPYSVIFAAFGVTIGKNCLVSSNCGISSYNHSTHSLNRRKDEAEDYKFSKPVVIGDNVWIGMNSCILPGVEIGDNSIIGSGSVVTKTVPPNQIWAGNPARLVKYLQDEHMPQNTASV